MKATTQIGTLLFAAVICLSALVPALLLGAR